MMTSRFTFPVRFLNKQIVADICNYYDIDVGRITILDHALILGLPFDDHSPIQYAEQLAHEDAITYEEGLIHLFNDNHYDSQQNMDLVELFQSLKIPYDSLQADWFLLHAYRPHLHSEPYQLPFHRTLETTVLPADFIADLLHTEHSPDIVVTKLLEGFKQFGGAVPDIGVYVPLDSNLFIPLPPNHYTDYS